MATSRQIYKGQASVVAFLDRAELYLDQSRSEEYLEDAYEAAYRSALRSTGALLGLSKNVPRKFARSSAWVKLKTVRPEFEDQLSFFENESRYAQRVCMGVERDIDPNRVAQLYDRASDLLNLAHEQLREYSEQKAA